MEIGDKVSVQYIDVAGVAYYITVEVVGELPNDKYEGVQVKSFGAPVVNGSIEFWLNYNNEFIGRTKETK